MVVSAGDPREDLENFMKIGEGSTGTVCIATYKSTGKIQRLYLNYVTKRYPFKGKLTKMCTCFE